MRHTVKQDTWENASFFGWDDETREEYDAWNNDTLTAAFERIIQRFAREQWNMDYEPYTAPGQGFCPPIPETLKGLGLLADDPAEQ